MKVGQLVKLKKPKIIWNTDFEPSYYNINIHTLLPTGADHGKVDKGEIVLFLGFKDSHIRILYKNIVGNLTIFLISDQILDDIDDVLEPA